MKLAKITTLGASLLIAVTAYAANPALEQMLTGATHAAPATLEKNSYLSWAKPILTPTNAVSAFTDHLFDWYEQEKDRSLPSQVYQDREKIFVVVDRPKQETIDLETQGEIEEATTVGAEVYSEMDGTPAEVLDAMLFRWGKPVGETEGNTSPPATPFSKRMEYFAPNPEWGPGAFVNLTSRLNGGIVRDLNDRYLMLVRGSAEQGFDIIMQYVKPAGATQSTQSLAIATIRPLGDGTKSAFKISTRYQGQNYKVLGSVTIGRNRIGFNVQNARNVQVDFARMLRELKQTGTIRNSNR